MAAGCVQNQVSLDLMFSCPVVHSDCCCSKFYHQLGATAAKAKAVRLVIMIFMPLIMSICGHLAA